MPLSWEMGSPTRWAEPWGKTLPCSTSWLGLAKRATQDQSDASCSRYRFLIQVSSSPRCSPRHHPGLQVAGSYLWGKLFLHAGHFTKDFDQAIYMRCAAICAAVATLGEATSPPMVCILFSLPGPIWCFHDILIDPSFTSSPCTPLPVSLPL